MPTQLESVMFGHGRGKIDKILKYQSFTTIDTYKLSCAECIRIIDVKQLTRTRTTDRRQSHGSHEQIQAQFQSTNTESKMMLCVVCYEH